MLQRSALGRSSIHSRCCFSHVAVHPRHQVSGVRCASSASQTVSTRTPEAPNIGRRGVIGLFVAAATALKLDGPAAAAAAAAAAPVNADADEDDSVGTRAIREYTDLEAKGKFKDKKALDEFRARYNFRRALDGRVSVRNKKGEWFAVRLDMEVAGALLMRNDAGYIFAVTTENIQQVDLSDDFVVMLMFAESDWETQLSPIELVDEDGKPIQLQLDEKAFRNVLGILKDMQEQDGDDDDDEQ